MSQSRVAVVGVAVAAIVLGIVVLTWTDITVVVVATLFGFHLVLLAATQLAVVSRGDVPSVTRAVVGVLGGYLLVVGLICLFSPFTSIRLLAVLTALGWLADAVAGVIGGARRTGGTGLWLYLAAGGSVVGALALMLWPALSLAVLVRLGGWLLIAFGAVGLASLTQRRPG